MSRICPRCRSEHRENTQYLCQKHAIEWLSRKVPQFTLIMIHTFCCDMCYPIKKPRGTEEVKE